MKQILALGVITTVLFSACQAAPSLEKTTSVSPTVSPLVQATAVPNQPTTLPAVTEGRQLAFKVVGKNFSFDLKEIRVKLGDRVKLTFVNAEGFHDWRVDEFNAFTQQIGAGKEDTISFVAAKVGMFEYYCSVGQHRSMGMVGKLIVE